MICIGAFIIGCWIGVFWGILVAALFRKENEEN